MQIKLCGLTKTSYSIRNVIIRALGIPRLRFVSRGKPGARKLCTAYIQFQVSHCILLFAPIIKIIPGLYHNMNDKKPMNNKN